MIFEDNFSSGLCSGGNESFNKKKEKKFKCPLLGLVDYAPFYKSRLEQGVELTQFTD